MVQTGAAYVVVDYTHPEFRVRVERGRAVEGDESIMFPAVAWSGHGDRPRLDVVLRGQVRDVENGIVRWLEPGDFTIGRALDSLYMRIQGAEVLLLSVEWNLGSLGTSAPVGLPTGTLPNEDFLELVANAFALLEPRAPRSETLVVGLIGDTLARLRSA